MIKTRSLFFILFFIFSLNKCFISQKSELLSSNYRELFNNYRNDDLSLKSLDKIDTAYSIINSTVEIEYHEEDYQIVDHKLILVPKNLQENKCSYGYNLKIHDFYGYINNVVAECYITNQNSNKICNVYLEKSNNSITFSINGQICKGDSVNLNFKYDKIKNFKEIYFKEELIAIPFPMNYLPFYCNYKYKIPEEYIYLGTKLYNLTLTKEDETTFSYKGECYKKIKADIIRYSPEKISWNADYTMSLEYPYKFTDDVNFIFPRIFKGAKYIINNYTVSSLEGQLYNEESISNNNIFIKAEVSAVNRVKVGIKIRTSFINKLTEDFKMYPNDFLYEIDLSKIDKEIIDKANELIKEVSDKPDYYKIGKFVNTYLTFDNSSDIDENITSKEIYGGKKGRSIHYTNLYNDMLNAIGIKTFILSGFIFDPRYLSRKLKHYWTLALINDKWIELDATYGFFEGISAGHIMLWYGNLSFYAEVLGKEKNLIKNENLKSRLDIEIIEINPKTSSSIWDTILGVIILVIFFIIIGQSQQSEIRSKYNYNNLTEENDNFNNDYQH